MIRRTNEHTCVVGLAWGDEGKGKIVDLLCRDYDTVVRFNGGANAGHTVCIGSERFALHLLPSGVLHPEKHSVIGPGVVVDPTALLEEIDGLAARGISVGGNLLVSDRAHVVMPYHKLEDRLAESAAEEDRIGTTARGIGPCYADKMRRSSAVRVCDLMDVDRLAVRVRDIARAKLDAFRAVYDHRAEFDTNAMIDELRHSAERLRRFVADTTAWLTGAIAASRRILFEGANGSLLDVDHGTYPYVTSSGTTASGVAPGAGVPARTVTNVLGVTKAYATRVGCGPFVSELNNETGDLIRERGREYGTTTGRPRRCGWFDAVATAYSVRFGGATEIALMHLDTLSGFDEVGLCTEYRLDGEIITSLPADAEALERVEPVIEMLPGWAEDVSKLAGFEELPECAKRYIERIESLVGAPITIVSVGPERRQTLIGDTTVVGPIRSTSTV